MDTSNEIIEELLLQLMVQQERLEDVHAGFSDCLTKVVALEKKLKAKETFNHRAKDELFLRKLREGLGQCGWDPAEEVDLATTPTPPKSKLETPTISLLIQTGG